VNNENKARGFNFGNFTLGLERRLLLRDDGGNDRRKKIKTDA
jgi:hypothetical protein